MAGTTRFDTPGGLRDVDASSPFYEEWHERINELIEPFTPGVGSGGFCNPLVGSFTAVGERTYSWIGFPRPHLVVNHRDDRVAALRSGEDRDAQHEYLEWHVTRVDSMITKVVFVTETPEYWSKLAKVAPDRVVALYRELVDPAVRPRDLFSRNGTYNPRNPWNHGRGIVHYIMGINSLEALLRAQQDRVISSDAQDNYDGLPLRFDAANEISTASDARFILDIAGFSREGLSTTVRVPVGLYMIEWDDTGWTKPDGSPVGDYWRVTRGRPGAALRLEYEVPAHEGFVVGDIRIGGRQIEYGGQIAEHIAVMAGGVVGRRRG